MKYKNKKILSDLWISEYLGKNHLCLLCKNNSGIIKTRDGDRYCICPNGRHFKNSIKINNLMEKKR